MFPVWRWSYLCSPAEFSGRIFAFISPKPTAMQKKSVSIGVRVAMNVFIAITMPVRYRHKQPMKVRRKTELSYQCLARNNTALNSREQYTTKQPRKEGKIHDKYHFSIGEAEPSAAPGTALKRLRRNSGLKRNETIQSDREQYSETVLSNQDADVRMITQTA